MSALEDRRSRAVAVGGDLQEIGDLVLNRAVAAGIGILLLWPVNIEIKAPVLLGYLLWLAYDWRKRRAVNDEVGVMDSRRIDA